MIRRVSRCMETANSSLQPMRNLHESMCTTFVHSRALKMSSIKAAAATAESNWKLYYFNVTGVAEPLRYLLHYCKVPYQDVRFEYEDWINVYKKVMPMEQVPVLEIDGVKYHQHLSICRYLAKKYNLYGDDDLEAMRIDAALDDINDIRTEIGKYYNEVDDQVKPVLKDRVLAKIPFYVDKFENQVARNGGHFVNGKLTLVDIYYAGIVEIMSNIVGENINEGKPCLTKLISKIRTFQDIKVYLETRPTTVL
ncbi:hypothetical protein TKK_0014363 [Trichogramma kaykai]|uniref:glutathione transferase n=1 Tax=Trichogramma kaykai TaxID=54128 RepID=A0ABD2WE05_9HYME